MKIIARIETEFSDKFGIPRQSNLVPQLKGRIVFEPEFRNADAIRGIEEFSYIWLLWEFSESQRDRVSLTVAPPRLGGKVRKGVFATRSPFRPNPIGLSSVRLEGVEMDEKLGPVLVVSGADLLSGTPIYDIKPYLPYADCHPDARGGFADAHSRDAIEVVFPDELLGRLPEEHRQAAIAVLEQDPRAAFNKKPDYVYGLSFAGFDIRFTVTDKTLQVTDVVDKGNGNYCKVK